MHGSRLAWSAVTAATIMSGLIGAPTASGDSTAPAAPAPKLPTPVPAKVVPTLKTPVDTTAAPADTTPTTAGLPASAAAAGALPASVSAANPAAVGDVIVCLLDIETPTKDPTTGIITSSTTVGCNGPALIDLGTELFADGVIPVGLPGIDASVTAAGATSESLCLGSGSYIAGSLASIFFPPGYVPLTSPVIGAASTPATITCP
jgi:hypothetical protein